jgi:hypothetical protein
MSASCDRPVPDMAHELPDIVSTEPCRRPQGHELPHDNETGLMWDDNYVGYLRTRESRPMDVLVSIAYTILIFAVPFVMAVMLFGTDAVAEFLSP